LREETANSEAARYDSAAEAVRLTHPDLDQIAATQFAVDRKSEQGLVAQAPVFVEIKTDRPDIARLQWALRSYHSALHSKGADRVWRNQGLNVPW
jgi:hypothetical protein